MMISKYQDIMVILENQNIIRSRYHGYHGNMRISQLISEYHDNIKYWKLSMEVYL